MIREITLTELKGLSQPFLDKQKTEDALLIRLCSNANSFYPHKLCTIYEIKNKNRLCGFATLYSGFLTLWLNKKPDFSELCSFLSTAPISSLECSYKNAKKIADRFVNSAVTYGKVFYVKKKLRTSDKCDVVKTENVSDFYNTVKISHKTYENIPYEAFYCDIFYRKNAKLFLLYNEEKPIATAAVMHRHSKSAILSDISVIPSFRRKGIATKLVYSVCEEIKKEGLNPMLFCTSPSAMLLYKRMGFKIQQHFCLISFS